MHTYYSNLSTKIQILQKLIAWQLHSLSVSQNKGRFKVFPKFRNPNIGGDQKNSRPYCHSCHRRCLASYGRCRSPPYAAGTTRTIVAMGAVSVSLPLRVSSAARVAVTITSVAPQPCAPHSLFLWLWLVVNDRKFSAGTIFFSHTNQSAVLLHKPATKRTSQPNCLPATQDAPRAQSHARRTLP